MNSLVYFIESNILLILFYFIYLLFFKRHLIFNATRFYLFFAILLSLILPFFKIEIHNVSPGLLYVIRLNEINITNNSVSSHVFHLTFIVYAVLLAGWLFFFISFIKQFFHLIQIIRNGNLTKVGKIRLVESDLPLGFSFFNYIFVNENLSDKGRKVILLHEQAHVTQGHSLDKMLAELTHMFFWFNPFTLLYRRAITEVHEYLADAYVLKHGVGRLNYQQSLLSQVFGAKNFLFIHYYNQSLIKNRIIMMTKKQNTKHGKTRLFLALLFSLAVILAFAFKAKPDNVVNVEFFKKYLVMENSSVKLQEDSVNKKEVFIKVTEMPKFNGGGPETFRAFIVKNLKYPESAKKSGIQGKVYVQFTVDYMGNVKDVNIVRGVTPALDEEAVRVIKLSPKWTPGKNNDKYVNVKFTFPVNFVLK